MLLSIAILLLTGLFSGWLCKKIHFPALFGMILVGILVGPWGLNLLDASLLNISSELRRIALIIILIRAGLKLDLSDLKKVGRPAALMCFVPASLEVAGVLLLGPRLLGLTLLEAAILGAVVAAVSPAVVVPRMIRLIDEARGTAEGIPQMILAGASVDDVFVIVLFTTFTGLAQGGSVSWLSFVNIPFSIALGVAAGMGVGALLHLFFERGALSRTTQVIVVFAVSFLLNWAESATVFPFAGLIAIMALGTELRKRSVDMARSLSGVFDQLWLGAELFLFVLVGASVAIDSARSAGPAAAALILGALVFRMLGVFLCVLGTGLSPKEKLFCMMAYTPKATVQAAIGGLPLAMGLPCGSIVLTVSVIAILITAPAGAFAIDLTYQRFLSQGKLPEA